MHWTKTHRGNVRAARFADRHYSRLSVGSPQFTPSGKTLVLLHANEQENIDALWISLWQPEPTHRWKQSWNCSLFRNESGILSSELVAEAVAATLAEWGEPLEDGMITFVNAEKTRRKRDPGRCFRRAGFDPIGMTGSGLHVLQLLPSSMPEPRAALCSQMSLLEAI